MEIIRSERHGVSFFSCPHPDWAGVAHAFSTRVGGVSPAPWDSLNLGGNRGDDPARVRENFVRFCSAVGADPLATVKNHQVHGTLIRPVTRADICSDPGLPGTFEADGLITNEPGVCLTVFSADCIPILFHDPVKRVAAAAHAGWRGTALGIAVRAVEAMVQNYGSRREDILAAIGPGISPCCFETRQDVPQAMREALGVDAEPFLFPQADGEHYHVDLKGINAHRLRTAGLSLEHIAVCDACTACRPDLFWSHRKLGLNRGSMAAVIQLI